MKRQLLGKVEINKDDKREDETVSSNNYLIHKTCLLLWGKKQTDLMKQCLVMV